MRRSLFALALLWLAGPARAAEPPAYADPPAALVTKAAGCDCGDACACPPGKCPDCKATADPRKSTVFVSQAIGGGSFAAGTGTVIFAGGGKSLILTNAHVVEHGHSPIYVTEPGGHRRHEALYWAGSSVTPTGPGTIHVNGPDLCLLAIGVELTPVEIADELPAVGATVHQYGFGGRMPRHGPTEKHGQVIPPRTSSPCLNTTIPSQSGDSGSGIFDDRGRLVGVCWGGDACQYAVRLDEVHAFTVLALADTRGPFARFRDRLAARAIAREPAPPSAPTIFPAVPGCPGGVCRPGGGSPTPGGCPGGACPRR